MAADTRSSRVVGGRLAAGCSFLFSFFQSSSLFLSVSLSSSDPPSTLRFLTLTHVSLHLCRRDVYSIFDIFGLSSLLLSFSIAAIILTTYPVVIESCNHRIRYVERVKRRLIKSFSGRWRAGTRIEENENVGGGEGGGMC